jgi:hypothetical protein
MASRPKDTVAQRVRMHAFSNLSAERRETTNLYVDDKIYNAGEVIGPKHQKVTVERRSVLVFADDDPRANFGHDCRYLLYDAKTGDFEAEVRARLPPIRNGMVSKTLHAFHEPIQFFTDPIRFTPYPPQWHCPIIVPDGARYAILYSGMTNKRHLNDLEFLYRTLVDIYAFSPENIFALSYDGTLNTQDGLQTHWPGDGSAYRIKITDQGTQDAFKRVINGLKRKMKSADTLLIHCNNHGDSDTPDGGKTWVPGTAFLYTYPSWGQFYNGDFCSMLAQLPKFSQLIVLLEQCHAGGFNAPIIASSTAGATSVASAATEFQNSYKTNDNNWDPFARDWIAAQAGHDPFGAPLAFNPDTDNDGKVEAREAYAYADTVKDPRDTPNYNESSPSGGDIALGQEYIVWWWWCSILQEALEPYWVKLPQDEYYRHLHRLQPELRKLTDEFDKTSETLRRQMAERIAGAIASTFKS